jgi:hypothetical protein
MGQGQFFFTTRAPCRKIALSVGVCKAVRIMPQSQSKAGKALLCDIRSESVGRKPYRWLEPSAYLCRWRAGRCPRILSAITIVRPETVVRWHRMGFVAYWRWKSRSPGGRPRIAKEVRDLIRRMSLENPFWGATKIHGELLKLGIQIDKFNAV